MNSLGGRKFIISVGVLAVATALLIWGKLSGDQYVQLMTWVTGLYLGANATQSIGMQMGQKPDIQSAVTVVTPTPPAEAQ